MSTLLNYVIEANFGLCLLLLVYELLLTHETDFKVKRFYLLMAVLVSVMFPFIHINNTSQFIPTLSNIVPPTWLPEVVISGNGDAANTSVETEFRLWDAIDLIYVIGLAVTLLLFIFRLIKLIKLFITSESNRSGNYVIVESEDNRSAFSFFSFIYIGQANLLSSKEKALIIQHELVHVHRLHSFDIMLMNILGIFFWFNPIIKIYKKTFIHLHEFEADARAVNNSDVDNYCSLLAKVALLSADFKLANHFSNSLTVKRIEMIRTLKSKIKPWKMLAVAATLPCLFIVVACQDQLNEITDLARNSTSALIVPEVVQNRYDELKLQHPKSKYIMLEFNEEAEPRLANLEQKYGIPKFIELFTPDAGQYKHSVLNTAPDQLRVHQSAEWDRASKTGKGEHTFAIIEYNDATAQVSESSKAIGDIFTIVEQAAQFPGGMDALIKFISSNLTYPGDARKEGIAGTSFVQFVVNTDGSISDAITIQSLSPSLDQQAIRVVNSFPKWIPARQNGEAVRQQFVIPLKFTLESSTSTSDNAELIKENPEEFTMTHFTKEENGLKKIYGKIEKPSGEPLGGTNIIIVGSTRGTTSDKNGNFVLEYTDGDKAVVASFVGFKTKEVKIQ